MKVRLSPEKHAKLQAFAARTGREPSDAVEIGRELRGDLPEQDEVIAWIESVFHE